MADSVSAINESQLAFNRRRFIGYFSTIGLGSTLLPGSLLAVAQDAPQITLEMVTAAARIAGITLPEAAMKKVVESLNGRRTPLANYQAIRDANLGNSTPLALVFNPILPGMKVPMERKPLRQSVVKVTAPRNEEDLAFLPVTHLSHLIRTRRISSTDLTKLYLSRLKKYDPVIHCVVTLTEDLALRQAKKADEEIAAGKYRGPLHGIPWGAKDLLAVKGYKTTFGASPYKDQVIDIHSTVFEKLTDAGAVLVAKLTLGALAQGDRWFGGQTKSPWDPSNPTVGSSGSSAGPASASVAGLVGFAIGTETRGSIISPSIRCGATGLRPTFGRVSRYGAMALSWSMDKIGVLCRSAEDCALVLRVINGADGKDNAVLNVPFNWDATLDVKKLRVGYLKSLTEGEIQENPQFPDFARRRLEQRKSDEEALNTLKALGLQLKPIELPKLPADDLGFILSTESAAAFDDLTRSEKLDMMSAEPEKSSWVETFRLHRFVPAVEYIQANRLRYRLMEQFNDVFKEIDLFVGSSLVITNLTGHPEISFPDGFDTKGQPLSLQLTGSLFGEQNILLLAHAFQSKTDFHRKQPKI
jgi:Asp-tRNA(Asn)/Glu-tRNA(Gln) amidotransferase A subunit family amidase